MPTNIRDPRSIITPDAFQIRPELLGTPLAGPWRRFWAMMIDLVIIGVLTSLLDSIQLLVWGVVGLFFLRIALQRQSRDAATVAVLLRGFAGCLGVMILMVVSIVGVFVYLDGDASDPPEEVVTGLEETEGMEGLEGVIAGAGIAGEAVALAREDDPDEVVDAAVDLLEELEDAGAVPPDPLGVLRSITPADAPWADQADSLYRVAVERWETERTPGEGAPQDVRSAGPAEAGEDPREAPGPGVVDAVRIRAEVDSLTDREAVQAWLRLTEVPDTAGRSPAEAVRLEALRLRVLGRVGSDTLQALAERVDAAAEGRADALEDIEDLRRELEATEGGFANLLRDIWEQLGSAIGIWSIYFTVLLTLWRGRTPGKRLVGVRVLRLDGEPMTWWSAFERAGGYIAGLATGLLGFAQVFWDPNRQCIHDKIVGTVVVREGATGVPGAWREAAGQSAGPDRPDRPGPPPGPRPPDRPHRPSATPPTREDRP